MNIVILGAGRIGTYLGKILSQESHNVILVDKDPEALERISREEDVATVCGHGSKWEVLDTLTEHSPDFFIAATGNDETNLVACSIAKHLGYPSTVARVKEIGFLTRSRIDFGKLFFVDHFIAPEVLAAHDILKSVIHPHDLAIENFAHGAIQMRTFIIPDNWEKSNVPIQNLDLPEEMIISLIRRKDDDETEKIIFPHGQDVILPKDEISIIGETRTMYDLHNVFSTPKERVKSVVVVGGSAVAYHLCHILEKMNIDIRIIEKQEAVCKKLANVLQHSTIINQDGTNLNFLASEQIQRSDALIACTSSDPQNILISLLAKQLGCKKIVSLISDTNLGSIIRNYDIQFSVSEKINIANKILSIIHSKTIISIASLCNDQAKVLEIKVSPKSQLVGIPLAKLSSSLPTDMLIAAIENRGRVMIGKGNRVISPHDTIILITSPANLNKLQDLF